SLPRDIDYDCARHELLEGNGVRRAPSLGEMDRRIEMRSTMLGCAELIRREEEAGAGFAVRQALQLERGWRCGPVDRALVERVCEIDHSISAGIEPLRIQCRGHQQRANRNRKSLHGSPPSGYDLRAAGFEPVMVHSSWLVARGS